MTRSPLAMLFLLLCSPELLAADWPHWRGPERNGISTESSGWTKAPWLAEQPLWQVRIGEGSSSPIVVDKEVFVLGHAGGKDVLRCLDARTGKETWSVTYKSPTYGRFHEGDEGLYSGPSSTPEYDPTTGYLYTLSIDGELHCWNTKERGNKVWVKNLYDAFAVPRRPKLTRAPRRDYGYTSSPFVSGDWLLVEVGSPSVGNVIAFDKRSGKQVWASESKDEAGHTGGMAPIRVEGVPCVAVLTQRHLAVIRLDAEQAGKTVAQFPWVTDFANTIASPAVQDDCVLITSAYNQNAICKVKVSLNGAKEVWRQSYPSKVCTPIIHRDRVYLAWQKVRCLNWETGKLEWEGGSFGDPGSCILTADQRLIVYGHNGKLALVETAERSPNKYVELAVRDRLFRNLAWPHVALASGRIFCRDRAGNLACFTIANPPSQ